MGGTFSGRLMRFVRDQLGLTYGISALIEGDEPPSNGLFCIWGNFENSYLLRGVEKTKEILADWHKNGVTKSELDECKSSVTGSMKVSLGTTQGLANQILFNEQRGRDTTYLDQIFSIINKVSLEQVNAAIKKYISPQQVFMVFAGGFEDSTIQQIKKH